MVSPRLSQIAIAEESGELNNDQISAEEQLRESNRRIDQAADPVLCEVDPQVFPQAVLNLLINAQQAIALQPDRGDKREQIVVGTRAVQGGVEVLVIDTGPDPSR